MTRGDRRVILAAGGVMGEGGEGREGRGRGEGERGGGGGGRGGGGLPFKNYAEMWRGQCPYCDRVCVCS